MKIVHLCLDAVFIDGYSYQENLLPKYHVKMGYEVTVIASLQTFTSNGCGGYLNGYSEYEDKNGFHVVRLEYKKPVFLNRFLKRYKRFSEILNREAPDIIFSHNIGFADSPILARYLKKHPNVRFYADNHGDYINSARYLVSRIIIYPLLRKPLSKILEPYMSKCFGVTPMRCRFLKEMLGINPAIIEFLPMGVDDDAIPDNRDMVRRKIRSELSIPEEDFVVFTGGKIDMRKNIHKLIAVLDDLNYEKLHLIICGTLTPEMNHLKKNFDTNHNIHYLGWCSAARVIECMIGSDMACFPGTHSTLWEQSVGIGLPAIFNHWNEMEHVNVNGNCILVDGDDEKDLKNSILEIVAPSNYQDYLFKAKSAAKFFLYSEIAKKSIGIN